MKIESIRFKNFKSFKDAELSDLPNLCIIVGANVTGKSTIFQVFQFLRDAMNSNVKAALARLGGSEPQLDEIPRRPRARILHEGGR